MPGKVLQGIFSLVYFVHTTAFSISPMKRSIISSYFSVKSVKYSSTSGGDNTSIISNVTTIDEVRPSTEWDALSSITSDSWRSFFEEESKKLYFTSLLSFVHKEQTSHTIYPPANEIFTAFNLCPLDHIRVVIIGQDPYHGENQAHGLAFSVKNGIAIPPSLRNIITELKADIGITQPSHGNLQNWSTQGVLLLNACLTVREKAANSHQGKGWEVFTDSVIRHLGKSERKLVFLLWGKPAMAKCSSINSSRHKIISCSHPSPLSAYKTNTPFIGSRYYHTPNLPNSPITPTAPNLPNPPITSIAPISPNLPIPPNLPSPPNLYNPPYPHIYMYQYSSPINGMKYISLF